MRINSSGDAECASKDNKNCLWTGKCKDNLKIANANKNTSLSCGDEHKKKWGATGYESSNHWCSKTRKFFNDKYGDTGNDKPVVKEQKQINKKI